MKKVATGLSLGLATLSGRLRLQSYSFSVTQPVTRWTRPAGREKPVAAGSDHDMPGGPPAGPARRAARTGPGLPLLRLPQPTARAPAPMACRAPGLRLAAAAEAVLVAAY